jgi:hypothetical protein
MPMDGRKQEIISTLTSHSPFMISIIILSVYIGCNDGMYVFMIKSLGI